MADKFITELSTTTTLDTADLVPVETNIPGTPITKAINWDALETLILDFQNYQIVASVSSNNLTIAIKYRDGNDFNVTRSGKMRVGNSLYGLQSGFSFTKNAGTNWCNAGGVLTASKAIDFFVYAIGETGTSSGLKFGFSRIPYAETMNDFVNTTTNDKYIAGNWTNFNASDAVKNIGRFRAQLSASASFNWSIASQLVINRPIYETGTLDYTPAVSSLTGTITSSTINSATYILRMKQMYIFDDATITNNGTGASAVIYTHPFTIPDQMLLAREYTAGFLCYGATQGGNIYLRKYDETYPGATGRQIKTSGWLNLS